MNENYRSDESNSTKNMGRTTSFIAPKLVMGCRKWKCDPGGAPVKYLQTTALRTNWVNTINSWEF